jgi:hypothetical protein
MQDHSAHSRTFFHRTNVLAMQMGKKVEDLYEFMGMARRTFFECRSADSAVSEKSWLKLDAAEKRFSKKPVGPGNAVSYGDPKESGIGESAHMMREEPTRLPTRPLANRSDPALLAVLERIAKALETLSSASAVSDVMQGCDKIVSELRKKPEEKTTPKPKDQTP